MSEITAPLPTSQDSGAAAAPAPTSNITTLTGRIAHRNFGLALKRLGVPPHAEEGCASISAFSHAAMDIIVPANATLSDVDAQHRCHAALSALHDFFRDAFNAGRPDEEESDPLPGGSHLAQGDGAAAMDMAGDPIITPARPTIGSLAGGSLASGAGTKRRGADISMAERADIMGDRLSAGAQSSPGLLSGKPLDVVLYTPHLVSLYRSARAFIKATSGLCGHLVSFEGGLADMSDEAFEAAPLAPLMTLGLRSAAGADPDLAAHRASLFSSLNECRRAAAQLSSTTLLVQRTFWLGNHTTGADWETVRQLEYRKRFDADGMDINPGFVQLETWEDEVKAAIVGCNREKEGLTKDGKALAGPVHPSILAKRHAAAKAGNAGGGQAQAQQAGGRPFGNRQSRINARLGSRGGGYDPGRDFAGEEPFRCEAIGSCDSVCMT